MKKLIRKFALYLLSWSDSCPTCGASWSEHTCPQTAKLSGRVCSVCEVPLPASALRQHHGAWRCQIHKTEV